MRHLGQVWANLGAGTGSSRPTALTAPASLNTKGAWTELSSGLGVPANGFIVCLSTERAGAADWLFDIGIGAAGSEVVLVPNLYAGCTTAQANELVSIPIPIRIPGGQRLSMRYQASNITSEEARGLLLPYGCGPHQFSGYELIEDLGTDTSDSGGTQVEPGGTANTKGSWSQLIASTANPYKAILVAIGNQARDTRSGASWLVDIGIGAAAAETTLVPNLPARVQAATDLPVPRFHGPLPVHIPAGTRISARAQCSINTAGDRLLDAIVYGLA